MTRNRKTVVFEKIDNQKLNKLIKAKIIKNIDLTDLTFNGADFTSCTLTNVRFSNNDKNLKLISKVNFSRAKLKNVEFGNAVLLNLDFSNALLENCSFEIDNRILEPTLSKVSFAESSMDGCRFHNSIIEWCDFRYAEITNTTFQNAKIDFCDFYRTYFHKINIFKNAQISNSSLNYTLFEGSIIRKENIIDGAILQENRDNYRKFLVEWEVNGPGIRQASSKKDWKPIFKRESNEMFKHAENIYRNLSGNWASSGFLSDSNWAYIKAKRMERKRLVWERKNERNYVKKIFLLRKSIGNWLIDFSFGYGESAYRTIRTYVLTILFFTILLYNYVPLDSLSSSIICSFKNMIAQTPDELKGSESFIITLMSVVQSTLGILLTGIFGFIIANKIRNQ